MKEGTQGLCIFINDSKGVKHASARSKLASLPSFMFRRHAWAEVSPSSSPAWHAARPSRLAGSLLRLATCGAGAAIIKTASVHGGPVDLFSYACGFTLSLGTSEGREALALLSCNSICRASDKRRASRPFFYAACYTRLAQDKGTAGPFLLGSYLYPARRTNAERHSLPSRL